MRAFLSWCEAEDLELVRVTPDLPEPALEAVEKTGDEWRTEMTEKPAMRTLTRIITTGLEPILLLAGFPTCDVYKEEKPEDSR